MESDVVRDEGTLKKTILQGNVEVAENREGQRKLTMSFNGWQLSVRRAEDRFGGEKGCRCTNCLG